MANSIADARQDLVKEAKDMARDVGKAASSQSKDIQGDLAALRDDVSQLTSQVTNIVSTRGGAAWRSAKANVEGVVSEVQDKGMEAVGAAREVSDTMISVIDESIEKRPYTTLAVAAGIGFLVGAAWRR
jgi:ElaB/YqjD/DUF883 family membrane-anchored ribosome-binding protein